MLSSTHWVTFRGLSLWKYLCVVLKTETCRVWLDLQASRSLIAMAVQYCQQMFGLSQNSVTEGPGGLGLSRRVVVSVLGADLLPV